MMIMSRSGSSRGFSLLEILVTIAIIGFLSTIVIVALRNMRGRAREAEVQTELDQIRKGIIILESDTSRHPNNIVTNPCDGDTEIDLNTCEAGLLCTDGSFLNWQGPYLTTNELFTDPWGNPYEFDPDYDCSQTANVKGCPNSTSWYRALVSHGPNGSASNAYDADNIILPLCQCTDPDCKP